MTLIVEGLTTERRVNPLGIDARTPLLSWRLVASQRDVQQSAYQIQVATSLEGLEQDALVWDTGRVASRNSVLVRYLGPNLASRSRYWWRIRIWTIKGSATPWSDPAFWEMALLDPLDWSARWVGYRDVAAAYELHQFGPPGPVPILRRRFTLTSEVQQARLYITALGLYDARLNGQRIGDVHLAPGWTDYRRRVEYQTYDVTSKLRRGANVLGVTLADGWYAGRIAVFGRGQYGDFPCVLCQLEITLLDGSKLVVASDGNWRAAFGGTVAADLLAGEEFDARNEPEAWDEPGFDDSAWAAVEFRAPSGADLIACRDEGIRTVQDRRPVEIRDLGSQKWLIDAGQNVAGVVRIQVPPHSTVSLRHGETLDGRGALYTANLAGAEQVDTVTTESGVGLNFEPRFTYHGFRFVEISGYPRQLKLKDVSIRAISSADQIVGSFECSDPLVNRLQENIVWTLRDNFVSIPTDCPQRDERLGWLGDVQVFAPTALFNADVANFLTRWLEDVVSAQAASGAYPDLAPVVGVFGTGNAGWADAGVIIPWTLYERTGDLRVLYRHYESMRKYIAFLEMDQTAGIRNAGRYADWLARGPSTPKDVVGTAYLAYTARIFGQIADIMRHRHDARRARGLAKAARTAFVTKFIDLGGILRTETQTGYALALAFGLLPKKLRAKAADRLAALVEADGVHLATGFIGTSLVLCALSDNGHHDLACRLVRQDSFPSWLFAVGKGATTIWERWNGWSPEAGFADPASNSLNHFAFGSVGDWLYRYLAGLDIGEPGYRRTRIHPRPGGGFTSARARHHSLYGEHFSSWELDGSKVRGEVVVPPNTSAELILRVSDPRTVKINGRRLESASDTESVPTSVQLGSGRFQFEGEFEHEITSRS